MILVVTGLNHNSSPIHLREKLAPAKERVRELLHCMLEISSCKSAMLISTCNRIELYAVVSDLSAYQNDFSRFFDQHFLAHAKNEDDTLSYEKVSPFLYHYSGDEAVVHLFRVAGSLDSLMIGEPQILGQVKDAYQLAKEEKTIDTLLEHLVQKAFKLAKKIRSDTELGKNAVSLSYAAVELAKKVFFQIQNAHALIVGAGEMGKLAAKHLFHAHVSHIVVTNRSFDTAQELASEINGTAFGIYELPHLLSEAHVIICSTGAQDYLITRAMMEAAIHKRKKIPTLLIDLSVPRNIEPSIHELPETFLYNIDDLKDIVEQNLQKRLSAAQIAESLIQEELLSYQRWLASLEITPVIAALRKQFSEIISGHIQTTSISYDNGNENIQQTTDALVNKLLHPTSIALKNAASNGHGKPAVDWIKEFFQIKI